ncbi:hypothetical protein N7486_009120 [Penicillium sp. IBT 16267x]|nr:hypothetical protein N7486_009120 [Penicillium sp. IBT 16267x]
MASKLAFPGSGQDLGELISTATKISSNHVGTLSALLQNGEDDRMDRRRGISSSLTTAFPREDQDPTL